MSSSAVGGGIHNPFAAEAHMTIQSLWTGPIVAGKDGARLSFWRRVVTAIAEGRQKKADAVVQEYLQRRAEYQDRNKR
jgi:DNA-binding FadR family transcriptional regulator